MHRNDYFKHRKAFDLKHVLVLDVKAADEMNSNAIEDMYQAFKTRLMEELHIKEPPSQEAYDEWKQKMVVKHETKV